jgi:RimJ/RimL family protein N-acetyltransferase
VVSGWLAPAAAPKWVRADAEQVTLPRRKGSGVQVFLETPRLVLRRFTMADVDNLVSLDADPDVMHFVTGGIPTARGEIEQQILPAFLDYYQRYEGYGFWAAIEKHAGEFLGWFHFRPRREGSLDEAELGYRLRKSAWGKGYATEGSRALIRKGFTEFGVQRVVAEAMAVNLASRRVMEKAGLTLVRTFRQPWPYSIEGDERGDVEYALTRADWERQDRTGHDQPRHHKSAAADPCAQPDGTSPPRLRDPHAGH